MFSINSECRKVRKPKIEKLRRARINSSLESLKEILLCNTISIPQGSRPTKLEKADILEMTVRYVEVLHEKLSISKGKILRKPEENFKDTQQDRRHEKAFGETKNVMSGRSQQQQKSESKMRLQDQKTATRDFDKENFCVLEMERENQSTFEEHHWRPW
jgi:hypothetical protein